MCVNKEFDGDRGDFLARYPRVDVGDLEEILEEARNGNCSRLDKEIDVLIGDLKGRANPGMPWLLLERTNRALIGVYGGVLRDAVRERILLLTGISPKELEKLTAENLVQCGYVDVVRVFIKGEPHPIAKLLAGRHRIICNVSVLDQLVTRFFAKRQNEAEIKNWTMYPSKPGIGFSDEDIVLIWQQIQDLGLVCATDIKAWDWTIQESELMGEAECRIDLMNNAGPLMKRLVRNAIRCMALSVFQTSDGKLWAQRFPGVMKSGSYITSSSNSRIRAFLAFGRGAEAMAMGDDCLEQMCDAAKHDVVSYYEERGHPVKLFEDFDTGNLEFCSMEFLMENNQPVGRPVSWVKTLYKLLYAKPTSEEDEHARMIQFKYELRHSPYLEAALRAISRSGWGRQNYC